MTVNLTQIALEPLHIMPLGDPFSWPIQRWQGLHKKAALVTYFLSRYLSRPVIVVCVFLKMTTIIPLHSAKIGDCRTTWGHGLGDCIKENGWMRALSLRKLGCGDNEPTSVKLGGLNWWWKAPCGCADISLTEQLQLEIQLDHAGAHTIWPYWLVCFTMFMLLPPAGSIKHHGLDLFDLWWRESPDKSNQDATNWQIVGILWLFELIVSAGSQNKKLWPRCYQNATCETVERGLKKCSTVLHLLLP